MQRFFNFALKMKNLNKKCSGSGDRISMLTLVLILQLMISFENFPLVAAFSTKNSKNLFHSEYSFSYWKPSSTKLSVSCIMVEEQMHHMSSHQIRKNRSCLHAKPKNRNRPLRNRRINNFCLLRPVQVRPILDNDGISSTFSNKGVSSRSERFETKLQISSGLTFDDGDQLLVSAQKPLGILLEERGDSSSIDGKNSSDLHMGCIVSELTPGGAAEKAGVKEGDLLVAVQNVDVGNASFEEVMQRIGDAPRVVNLRFWRKER
jgi:hypothetical protein